MNTFTNPRLLPAIKNSLDSLGFIKPTEIQSKVIPMLLDDFRQDVHAQAQTGTGKTLAFGIPLLQSIDASNKTVQALVMAPTRELVLQIYESLKDVSRGANITIEPIYGGMPIERQISKIKKGVHLIIGTPGRINDHLRRKTLHLDKLKILVLDEADIMLDMGFRQEIDTILAYAPKERHIWLFSATVMSGIKKLITSHMHNVYTIKSDQKNTANAQVKQYFCVVSPRKRVEATARFIAANHDFYGIVFCRTRALAGQVAEALAHTGINVHCLHGDMKQSVRNQVIQRFKKKEFSVLVATDVAARGIDVSDLTHVINYNIPDDIESYIHRIGRTGRAGKEGSAILFVSPAELYRMKRLERATKITLEEIQVPDADAIVHTKIGAVVTFIEQAKETRIQSPVVDKVLKKRLAAFTEKEIRDALAAVLQEKFFQSINIKKEIYTDERPALKKGRRPHRNNQKYRSRNRRMRPRYSR